MRMCALVGESSTAPAAYLTHDRRLAAGSDRRRRERIPRRWQHRIRAGHPCGASVRSDRRLGRYCTTMLATTALTCWFAASNAPTAVTRSTRAPALILLCTAL